VDLEIESLSSHDIPDVIRTDSQRVCVVIDPQLSEIGLMFVGQFLITGVENTQHLYAREPGWGMHFTAKIYQRRDGFYR
jgi:hypothetical protein